MDQYDRSRNQIPQSSAAAQSSYSPSFLTSSSYSGEHSRPQHHQDSPRQEDRQHPQTEAAAASLMRGAKRKRLAKACDACHKSKRRCDGTAPCSNCYFASKTCTYTDGSGRPVPAPHRYDPARANLIGPPPVDTRSLPFNQPQVSGPGSASDPPRFGPNHRLLAPPVPPPPPPPPALTNSNDISEDDRKNSRKRFRNDRGIAISPDDLVIDGPLTTTLDRPRVVELDHALMRELMNLFFAHCHPARSIIHKPTFSSNLSHGKVPKYLLHAVCALAAPLSKQPRIRTNPMRFAGRPFAQEALSLMFDGAGRLKSDPNLATAQALCLLQMHDIVTKEKNACWSSRYHDLALRIVEALGVHSPEHPTLTPVPSPEFISVSLEREAIRRIFWYIQLLDLKASIYFKKPITFTEAELRLRLPVDETSFELGVHSTLPEYLYLPAVRTQNASEFGHLVRIITIYAKMETILDEYNVPYQNSDGLAATNNSLSEAEQHMENWARTLPDHLRFSEQNLQVQQSMFETGSNTGAWCWCLLHIYHASCALAVSCARQRNQRDATMEPQWALLMIDSILQMVGDRAKNSLLLGAALWSLIKYCKRDDPQVRAWCVDYEEFFGTRMVELVQDWRPHPSPPQRHQFSAPAQTPSMPPSHAQPIQQPARPPHRLSDARHNGNGSTPSHNGRLTLAQNGDTSNPNRRSPNHSPGTTNSYVHGRYVDEEKSLIENAPRLPLPHTLSDSRNSHAGPSLPPPSTMKALATLALHTSGNGEVKVSIKAEQDGNGHRGDEPLSGEGLNGGGSPSLESLPSSNSGSGPSRNHSSGEGFQSLPSLKASGLLDWNHGARLLDRPTQGQGHGPIAPPKRSSPRRSPPSYYNIDESRTTIPPLSLPVGMKWLANDSR